MTRVCETVTATSMAELRRKRDAATLADLVELRLDGVADIDVPGALAGRTKPVIVTCRPLWEGGRFDGSELERLRLLSQAIDGGAEFVDVEWRADRSALPVRERTRMVVSHHVFDESPADLAARVRAMRADASGAVVKVAVTTPRVSDCVRFRDAVGTGTDQVAIAMGPAGFISRVCPWLFDSQWTYGGVAAPGQTSVADLVELYRVPTTSHATRIYALTGSPLTHSASPAMHNRTMAALQLDAVYVPIETDRADEFLTAADAFGIQGVSVTAPLKRAWAPLGVRIDSAGREIDAVNTLRRGPDGWEARNFDIEGFLAPLIRRGLAMAGQRVVILGAGGAARAVAWTMKRQGAVVEIASRRPEAAAQLAGDFGLRAVPWPPAPDWDLLVNATPVGTSPATHASPLPASHVRGRIVYDLVYNPAETALLKLARGAGAQPIGGLEMLIGQAHAQFEWWTGMPAPLGVMDRAAAEFLRQTPE